MIVGRIEGRDLVINRLWFRSDCHLRHRGRGVAAVASIFLAEKHYRVLSIIKQNEKIMQSPNNLVGIGGLAPTDILGLLQESFL